MSGTLCIPWPAWLAPAEPRSFCGIVLMRQSVEAREREHKVLMLLVRAAMDAMRLISPEHWRAAVARVEQEAEAMRMVDHAEMPAPLARIFGHGDAP